MSKRLWVLRLAAVLLLAVVPTVRAATVTVVPASGAGDPPNTGFFDPTPVAPVEGNLGTTVGQQRLIAFQAAADKWGATLTSPQPILVIAAFTALGCTANSGVLGAAAPAWSFADVPGLPPNIWFPAALAEKLTNIDIVGGTPFPFEIFALFNVNLGTPGCLENGGWYYGLDNLGPPNLTDLFTVVLHELGHGLGFTVNPTSSQTGARALGLPSIWEQNMLDTSTRKSWFDMTDAERAASAINTGNLVWMGGATLADAPEVLGFRGEIKARGPRSVRGVHEAQPASFGPPLTQRGLKGHLVIPSDSGGVSPADGCEPFPAKGDDDNDGYDEGENGNRIFLIDRGNCTFTTKVKNAQNAGAIAAVIANNQPAGLPPMGGSDPTIFIQSIGITQELGDAIKRLPRFRNSGRDEHEENDEGEEKHEEASLNVRLQLSSTIRAGTVNNKPRLYTPNPFEGGSSVSHWDTSASPNQLMEPFISGDLAHEVTSPFDLTFSLLSDLGW